LPLRRPLRRARACWRRQRRTATDDNAALPPAARTARRSSACCAPRAALLPLYRACFSVSSTAGRRWCTFCRRQFREPFRRIGACYHPAFSAADMPNFHASASAFGHCGAEAAFYYDDLHSIFSQHLRSVRIPSPKYHKRITPLPLFQHQNWRHLYFRTDFGCLAVLHPWRVLLLRPPPLRVRLLKTGLGMALPFTIRKRQALVKQLALAALPAYRPSLLLRIYFADTYFPASTSACFKRAAFTAALSFCVARLACLRDGLGACLLLRRYRACAAGRDAACCDGGRTT